MDETGHYAKGDVSHTSIRCLFKQRNVYTYKSIIFKLHFNWEKLDEEQHIYYVTICEIWIIIYTYTQIYIYIYISLNLFKKDTGESNNESYGQRWREFFITTILQ